MDDKLKKFVDESRGEFDTEVPANDLWNKIASQLDAKMLPRISSKWLSKFTYLGLSASALVLAVFFVTKNPDNSADRKITTANGSLAGKTVQNFKDNKNTATIDAALGEKNTSLVSPNKSRSLQKTTSDAGSSNNIQGLKKDSILEESVEHHFKDQAETKPANVSLPALKPANPALAAMSERKENGNKKSKSRAELIVPADPLEMNTYSGTIYEGSSFRSLMRLFKFPGQTELDKGPGIRAGDANYRNTVRTVSCSQLERVPNVRAVWIKGKTEKELTLSVKKKFKNILLVKPNGKTSLPEAISHYYPGLGVISEYKGRYFNMVFTNKVELILFFKDAEVGDKVIIDGHFVALIKEKF